MTFRDVLSHPAARVTQKASNLCFAAVFAFIAIRGGHIGTYLLLAFLAMTAVNIAIAGARKTHGS